MILVVNVFHINSNYLTSRLHENLIDKLQSKGVHSKIFMPRKQEKESEFLYKSKHEVYYPVAFNNIDKYFFLYKQFKIMNVMKKKYDFDTIDIVHAHTLFTDGNVANDLYKRHGIPYIVAVRGLTDIDGFFKKRINLRRRGREILRNASKIVFMSEANKKEVFDKYIKGNKETYERKSVIIPNGIDDFWFKNENTPKIINSSKNVKFIYVGKINKTKNVLKVVETLKVLKDKYHLEPKLTVVGQVIDKEIYEKLKATKDINLQICPPTDREGLIELYKQNDIFIMPSFTETFGLVYPEAMSQGLPVIYTKNQGFDKQFPDGEIGFAINPKDEGEIAEKILSIINNYENISKNCIKYYVKFDWNVISDKYINIYNSEKN